MKHQMKYAIQKRYDNDTHTRYYLVEDHGDFGFVADPKVCKTWTTRAEANKYLADLRKKRPLGRVNPSASQL